MTTPREYFPNIFDTPKSISIAMKIMLKYCFQKTVTGNTRGKLNGSVKLTSRERLARGLEQSQQGGREGAKTTKAIFDFRVFLRALRAFAIEFVLPHRSSGSNKS